MSKILNATCENQIVTVEGQNIEATILSEGIGSSSGIAIIDVGNLYYVASTAGNLKSGIELSFDAINKIAAVLTAIGAGMTGASTAPPATLAADVTAIQALATQLETLSENLK